MTGSFYACPWMGCYSTGGWTPAVVTVPLPIYTPGWSETLCAQSVLSKNTTQCPQPGLKPRLLDLESSALTMIPPCLHKGVIRSNSKLPAVGNWINHNAVECNLGGDSRSHPVGNCPPFLQLLTSWVPTCVGSKKASIAKKKENLHSSWIPLKFCTCSSIK